MLHPLSSLSNRADSTCGSGWKLWSDPSFLSLSHHTESIANPIGSTFPYTQNFITFHHFPESPSPLTSFTWLLGDNDFLTSLPASLILLHSLQSICNKAAKIIPKKWKSDVTPLLKTLSHTEEQPKSAKWSSRIWLPILSLSPPISHFQSFSSVHSPPAPVASWNMTRMPSLPPSLPPARIFSFMILFPGNAHLDFCIVCYLISFKSLLKDAFSDHSI